MEDAGASADMPSTSQPQHIEKKPKKSAEEKEAAKAIKRAKEAELQGGPLTAPTAEVCVCVCV